MQTPSALLPLLRGARSRRGRVALMLAFSLGATAATALTARHYASHG
jgi:hypothetical protein